MFDTTRAAELLKRCRSLVTLEIVKDAANQHGLSTLFHKSSEISHQRTEFDSIENSQSMSGQYSKSTLPLQNIHIYDRLSMNPIYLSPLYHQRSNSSLVQPYETQELSSTNQTSDQQHRRVNSIENKKVNFYQNDSW